MPRLAERTTRIASSPTMKVTATVDRLRREGVEVIDFGAGEPDFGTPAPINAAAHSAIDQDFTKYTPVPGTMELRRAICDRYKADYGVEYTEAEVITHAPYWPTLTEQVKLGDATPVIVRTHAEDGFAIGASAILGAVTPRTRGVIINSPCNPTGALIAETDLAAIADASASNAISDSEISAPVGLHGELMMIALVRGVMASINGWALIVKPSSMCVCTITGVASASLI